MPKNTNKSNKDSFINIKISEKEYNNCKKKLSIFSKKKVIASVITASALVLGGVGTATYFGITRANSSSTDTSGFKSGEIVIDPTFKDEASISDFSINEKGDKVGTITSTKKTIKDVNVSIGTKKLTKETEYKYEDASNNNISSKKVTIFKSTLEKYKGATLISPVFDSGTATIWMVHFETNGGTEIDPQKVEDGSAIESVTTTKGGCTFEYWCTDASLQNKFDVSSPITKDMTLYAKWKVDESPAGLTYYLNDNEDGLVVTFSGSKNNLKAIKIPATAVDPESQETLPVKEIGYNAFQNCTNLEQVDLPDSITTINSSAFYNCFSLTKINLPNGIKKIPSSCFSYCISLKNITLPETITSIESSAFYLCSSLESINLFEGIESIEYSAFAHTNLKSIYLPESLFDLGGECFRGCSNLSEVTFKSKINTIPYDLFAECSSLSKFKLTPSITQVESGAFMGTSITTSTFEVDDIYSGWEYYDAAEGGEWYSFDSSLIVEKLLSGNSIQKGAFKDTSVASNNLFKFNYIGDKEVEIMEDDSVISGEGAIDTVTIPTSITVKGVELSVTSIVDSGFEDMCTHASKIVIPSTIEKIGDYAFSNYYEEEYQTLTEVQFLLKDGKSNLNTIGESAFNSLMKLDAIYCDSSKVSGEITLPEGLTTIENCAFNNLPKITSINIPSTVESLEYGVGNYSVESGEEYYAYSDYLKSSFYNMTGLEKVNINSNNEKFCSDDNGLVYLKENGENSQILIYFPDGKKTESTNDPISEVVIPEGVKRIYSGAITGKSNYTSMSLPSTLNTLDYRFCYVDSWDNYADITTLTIKSETIVQYSKDTWYDLMADEYYNFISKITSFVIPNNIEQPSAGSYIKDNCGLEEGTSNNIYYPNVTRCSGDAYNGYYSGYFIPKENRTCNFICDLGDTYGRSLSKIYFGDGNYGSRVDVFGSTIVVKYGVNESSMTELTLGQDYHIDTENKEIVLDDSGKHDTGVYSVIVTFDDATYSEGGIRLEAETAA